MRDVTTYGKRLDVGSDVMFMCRYWCVESQVMLADDLLLTTSRTAAAAACTESSLSSSSFTSSPASSRWTARFTAFSSLLAALFVAGLFSFHFPFLVADSIPNFLSCRLNIFVLDAKEGSCVGSFACLSVVCRHAMRMDSGVTVHTTKSERRQYLLVCYYILICLKNV